MDNKLLSLKWPTCLRKFILICCTCMFRWAPWDLEHLVCKNIFAYTQQHLRIKPHKITNTVVPDRHNNCFVQQGQNRSALSCQKQSSNRVNTNVQLHQHTCSEYILRIGVLRVMFTFNIHTLVQQIQTVKHDIRSWVNYPDAIESARFLHSTWLWR